MAVDFEGQRLGTENRCQYGTGTYITGMHRTETEREFRLERLTDAEGFVKNMKLLYTSTLCVSSEKSPTCGQILPILTKLEEHFTVAKQDTVFISTLKEKVWGDLEKRYQDEDIKNFLQEAILMDPRFKSKLGCAAVAADAWGRLEKAAVCNVTAEQLPIKHNIQEESEDRLDDHQEDKSLNAEEHSPYHKKCAKKSALEELFEDEDRELLQATTSRSGAITIVEQAHNEIKIYQGLPSVSSGQDPVAWWWGRRDFPYCLHFQTHTFVCRPHLHHLRGFSPVQGMQ
ncbi:E3 SUMO-protein ligase ZBED1 [Labeo rohita]|uniref:E3 SUMO-protein ligase ZBED1 n=1 Tax=Labeo rohita TaxID=84645 RepID=A0ABQ8L048_LABRO|nr:E3 SUMO-protein ligase ZBED1 [Labeo rohita]